MSAPQLTYTVPEAAEVLGIGRSAAYQAVHTGEIPSIKIGYRIIIPKVALERKLSEAGQSERESQ
jgi:excisionase family DNA binding protein